MDNDRGSVENTTLNIRLPDRNTMLKLIDRYYTGGVMTHTYGDLEISGRRVWRKITANTTDVEIIEPFTSELKTI